MAGDSNDWAVVQHSPPLRLESVRCGTVCCQCRLSAPLPGPRRAPTEQPTARRAAPSLPSMALASIASALPAAAKRTLRRVDRDRLEAVWPADDSANPAWFVRCGQPTGRGARTCNQNGVSGKRTAWSRYLTPESQPSRAAGQGGRGRRGAQGSACEDPLSPAECGCSSCLGSSPASANGRESLQGNPLSCPAARYSETALESGFCRAQWGTRTPDPFLTMEVLYQLS